MLWPAMVHPGDRGDPVRVERYKTFAWDIRRPSGPFAEVIKGE